MSNLSDLWQDVDDLSETFKSLEGQHRQFSARVSSLIRDLEACLQDIDVRMKLNQAEHERLMQDYDNAKSLLEKLNSFLARENGPCPSSGGTLELSSYATRQQRADDNVRHVVGQSRTGVDAASESQGEADPEQVRLGLQRMLRKIGHEVPAAGSGAPKPGERRKQKATP